MATTKTYFVKQSWIFNLEAAYEKLRVVEIDLEEDILTFPLELIGQKVEDFDDLQALVDEVEKLTLTAKTRKVTGKEYGRIKEVVTWRVGARYMACLKGGMNEKDAGRCFEDL